MTNEFSYFDAGTIWPFTPDSGISRGVDSEQARVLKNASCEKSTRKLGSTLP